MQLDDPSEIGIRKKIDEILSNPNTISKTRKSDGAKLYMDEEGNALIYNPNAKENKGTLFYPFDKGSERFFEEF